MYPFPALLFADGIVDVIIVLIGVAIWGVSAAIKSMQENTNRKRPPPRAAAGQQAEQDPQKELERFLEDLGVRKPAAPPAANRPPQEQSRPPRSENRRRERRKGDRKPQQDPASVPVSQRHLESNIPKQRQQTFKGNVESQHLETRISQLRAEADAVRASEVADIEHSRVAAAARRPGDPLMMAMLQNRGQLSRAFILGEVLGAPLALRQQDPQEGRRI